jgi:hypothetical protein
MTIILGIFLVIVGGAVFYGGISGNLAKMIGAVTNHGKPT